MIRCLIAFIFIPLSGFSKELGPTQVFKKKNEAARSLLEKSLPDGNFKIQWAREGEDWEVFLSSKEEQVSGKIQEGVFVPTTERGESKLEDSLRDRRNKGEEKKSKQKAEGSFPKWQRIDKRTIEIAGQTTTTPSGWIWDKEFLLSPDEKWLCLERVRDVRLREVRYVRSSPEDRLQPKSFKNTYSKPGDELRTRVPVVFGKDGQGVEADSSLIANPYSISNLHWRSESKLWFEYIERGFGIYRLLELDATTGKTRVVAEESSEKFVHVFEKCGWWNLGQGKLLWRSEADGWSHLYLIDEQTGSRQQLTKGEWVVREVNRIDGDEVYFKLSGYYPKQDPYFLHNARLNIKTGELTMLTDGDGTHSLFWSPDRSYYVDRYSRVDLPPSYELRQASDGALLTELWRFDEKKLAKVAPLLPERFVSTDREGRYEIHGVIWKPKDFDPTQKYPVVENIYAGPHGAFVPKGWRAWHGHKSEMAAAGFVVVQIDGRGTNFRGQEFQQYCYKNLRDSGFPDRIKWIEAAAKERPWMDLSRVGIYGGSAGGQSTLAALLWHGDFYHAGAADCGCHDNRMDKIWWNEQWMDWPVDDSYRENSNTEHVTQLRGDLLLTVGEVDTNVDPSSTYQVVDALIEADKDFDFFLIPNGGHGIGESLYLRRKRVEFFQRSLQSLSSGE